MNFVSSAFCMLFDVSSRSINYLWEENGALFDLHFQDNKDSLIMQNCILCLDRLKVRWLCVIVAGVDIDGYKFIVSVGVDWTNMRF